MKIAFLIQDITTSGGTERTTCCLAKQLSLQGDDVTIVSIFRNNNKPAYSAGDKVKLCYITNKTYDDSRSYFYRLFRCLSLRKKVINTDVLIDADVVICQKIFASLLAFWCGFCRKSVACEHFKYGMYNGVIRCLRNMIYRKMKSLVVLTDADKQQFINHRVTNVECIPNMVSVEPLLYCGYDSKTIVSVGRLTEQKGYDMLIRAVVLIADEMGDFCLDIYGEGEKREELESLCKKLKVDNKIHFLGYESSISRIYSQSLFYVMSSRFEGFPMVLLEAAACELPIVSFDCPEGPKVLLKDGGGIIVEKENVEELGKAILKMIKDKEFREMCRKQTQQIIKPYLPSAVTALWRTFLLNLFRS